MNQIQIIGICSVLFGLWPIYYTFTFQSMEAPPMLSVVAQLIVGLLFITAGFFLITRKDPFSASGKGLATDQLS